MNYRSTFQNRHCWERFVDVIALFFLTILYFNTLLNLLNLLATNKQFIVFILINIFITYDETKKSRETKVYIFIERHESRMRMILTPKCINYITPLGSYCSNFKFLSPREVHQKALHFFCQANFLRPKDILMSKNFNIINFFILYCLIMTSNY